MKTDASPVTRFVAAAIATGLSGAVLAADNEPVISADLITRAEATRAAEAALAGCAGRGQPAIGHTNQLASLAVPARDRVALTVTSPAFKDGGDIPRENTQYGANLFPGLSWSKGPKGTQSYVVIVQGDPASGSTTSVHFTLFNVPKSITRLERGMTSTPGGASYGATFMA